MTMTKLLTSMMSLDLKKEPMCLELSAADKLP